MGVVGSHHGGELQGSARAGPVSDAEAADTEAVVRVVVDGVDVDGRLELHFRLGEAARPEVRARERLPHRPLGRLERTGPLQRDHGCVCVVFGEEARALLERDIGGPALVLLQRGEVFYILEVVRGRFLFDALKRKVMEVKQRYGSPTLLIEDSPISRGLIQSLREQSINVTVYKPDTDKRARVIAQSDLFA